MLIYITVFSLDFTSYAICSKFDHDIENRKNFPLMFNKFYASNAVKDKSFTQFIVAFQDDVSFSGNVD
jgi:hypothetical protein